MLLLIASFSVCVSSAHVAQAQLGADGPQVGAAGTSGEDLQKNIELLAKQVRFLEGQVAALQKLIENQPRLDHLYYAGHDRHHPNIEELSQYYLVGDGEPPASQNEWSPSPNLVEKYGVPKEAIAVQLEIDVYATIESEGAKANVQVDVQPSNKKGGVYSVRAAATNDEQSSSNTLIVTLSLQEGKFLWRADQQCLGEGSSYSRQVRIKGYMMPIP